MKKVYILLMAVIFIFSLVACDGGSAPSGVVSSLTEDRYVRIEFFGN